jgi:hypothetical protein
MAQGEWKGTTDLIEAAIAILREQQPCTIRQLFYLMIGVGPLVNDPASYRKMSRIIVKARRDRRVPYEWICDRTRPVYEPNVWKSPQEYGEAIKRGYRRDYWQWQRVHVEIWSEKDTVVGSIEDLAAELGVTIRVCRGFNSETRVHQIARILAESGKPNVVLFLGDHARTHGDHSPTTMRRASAAKGGASQKQTRSTPQRSRSGQVRNQERTAGRDEGCLRRAKRFGCRYSC